jgi:ribosomal protein S12 methylthiotransferase accessory factor
VEVLDASLGGRFPVTAISLINPQNGTLFVSFGAHPILQVSLERTMTELMQGRELENLDAFETPTFDMSLVADSFNLESHFIDSNGRLGFGFLSRVKSFAYTPWTYEGEGSEAEYAYLEGIVRSLGAEVYLREYDYLGFYSCQMLVPGISEVYPVDDLVYNNKNEGKRLRGLVLEGTQADPGELLDALEALEETLKVGKFIGVIFETEFTVGELKAQLLLRLGAYDEALPLLEYAGTATGRVVAELIRMRDEGLAFGDFETAMGQIYTPQRVAKAVAVLEGEASLVDLAPHRDYRNMLAMFDRLEGKREALVA